MRRGIERFLFRWTLALAAPAAFVARGEPGHRAEPNPPFSLPPLGAEQERAGEGGFQPLATPSVEWTFHKTADGSHPNGMEQEMVWLMNRARSDPAAEGAFLAGIQTGEVLSQYNAWGVDLEKMQAEFAGMSPRAPAAFDRRLYEASAAHSAHQISVDAQTHDGQLQRIGAAGFDLQGVRLSVFWVSRSALHAHAAFNVDWGGPFGGDGMQPGRGHRVGLMGYIEYPVANHNQQLPNVGIAMLPESNQSTQAGPYVTSIAYAVAQPNSADHFNKFIVGTVWTDLNQDGRFNAGEGVAGVTVMPDSGSRYAVTGDAGGFAIPVSQDREYTLTYSGGGLQGVEQRKVVVAGQSALAIWRPEDAYGEPEPELVAPSFEFMRDGEELIVAWDGESGYSYTLQRSTDGLASFADDPRAVSENGMRYSFRVSAAEMADEVFFRLVVER